MVRKTVISIIATTIILLTARAGVCAPVTVEKVFPAIEWSFQGKPIPETQWSPWIPLLSQQVLRLKFGFRFSSGTIGAKCPVKLTFTYDPAQATSGGEVPIKVKAELLGADYNTFESAFGISLPNQMQIGFFGISGLPDFLPWWDLPWDFWDFVSFVPKVGDAIASAEQNIGVNTSSKEALPLGSTKSYHDQRTLISVDMSEIAKKYKTQLAPSVYNKLSSALGNDGMEALLTTIAVAKGVSENAAVDILTGLCGEVVEKAAGFASIALKGDPYFSVEGLRLGVNMRCFIPGGKGSGSYILYFTQPGQEQTFKFYDITPFIDAGDKLKIVVDRIDYEFKLRQGLTAQAGISLATINLDNVEKVVSYVHATRDYTENDFKIEVPLSASTATIQSLRVGMGCTSAQVSWASPIMPLKGTVKAYDGGTLVKTVSETGFLNAHSVIITGLTKNKTYKFTMECIGEGGQSISGGEVTGTTQGECQAYKENAVAGDLCYVSVLPPTPGRDFVDFNWVTNRPASTEVMISPSPELTVTSMGCIKKDDGTPSGTVVQGWGTRGGERKLETNHSIRVTGLEPGVKYYYLLRSWSFQEDNPQKPERYCIGKLGEVTTPAIPVPQMRVKVQFRDVFVPDVPILVSKVGNASYRLVVQTDPYGITPLITLDKGQKYTFAVKDNGCFEDAVSSPVDVPNSDCGEMASVVLTVTSKPSPGGYVLDTQGNPIGGATVKMLSPVSVQTTTDSKGHYTFAGWFDFMGGVIIDASKQDYVTKRIIGKVEACSYARLLTVGNCILPSAIAKVNFVVKTQKGNAVNGASIVVKESGTVKGALTTDSQGKATFSYNPGDNNLNNHTLEMTMQPPTGAKIRPKTASLTTIGGSEQTCEIPCLEVTTGPLISKVVFSQSGLNCVMAAFEVSDEDANSCLEYTRPDGQTGTTNWVKGGRVQGSGVSSHACLIQGNPIPTGAYNIKVKAMDVFGISRRQWQAIVQH
jgi:hypothetical protein